MAFELDHVFVCTARGAPVASRLVSLGLTEGSGNLHSGQGTANRRFFFRNAMLELLWVSNEQEARSEVIAPTRLWERSPSQRTGASPFGICLRSTDGTATALPFRTWSYRPPYLPPGMEIAIARTISAAEPLLFAIPFGGRPDAYPSVRREPVEHPKGFREISAVRVTLPGDQRPSASLRAVERLGIARFVSGGEHLLELSFDGALQGKFADLRPELPLVFHW